MASSSSPSPAGSASPSQLVLNHTPYTTSFAAVTPRITGGLSTISSFLIIYLILKSEKKLSTIYHRIMFGMSVVDILGSIAMALTTLPMPKYLPDVGNGDEFSIPYEHWSGSKLGNTQTCDLQGFFFIFGYTAMFTYNAALCVYYAFAIAFQMKEKHIHKYVEPFLHLVPFSIGLFLSIIPLLHGNYNPNHWEAWCSPIPYGCDLQNPDADCARGTYNFFRTVETAMIVTLGLLIFTIVTTLSMVSIRVIRTSKDLEMLSKAQLAFAQQRNLPHVKPFPFERIRKSHESTKAVLRQALVYVLAFVLTLISPIIQIIYSSLGKDSHWPNYLELVFTPLQGFFNFAIFVYYKVDNVRRSNPEFLFSEVLRLLFTGKLAEPVMISRISLIQIDEVDRGVLEVSILNENKEEYLSYDVSNASPLNEIDSADRERVDEGLSFVLENVPRESHSLYRDSAVSSGGNVNEVDELGFKASIQLAMRSFSTANQHVVIPDGASSTEDLSGFDELASSSVHERSFRDDT